MISRKSFLNEGGMCLWDVLVTVRMNVFIVVAAHGFSLGFRVFGSCLLLLLLLQLKSGNPKP